MIKHNTKPPNNTEKFTKIVTKIFSNVHRKISQSIYITNYLLNLSVYARGIQYCNGFQSLDSTLFPFFRNEVITIHYDE